jgi:hypothetical protein
MRAPLARNSCGFVKKSTTSCSSTCSQQQPESQDARVRMPARQQEEHHLQKGGSQDTDATTINLQHLAADKSWDDGDSTISARDSARGSGHTKTHLCLANASNVVKEHAAVGHVLQVDALHLALCSPHLDAQLLLLRVDRL